MFDEPPMVDVTVLVVVKRDGAIDLDSTNGTFLNGITRQRVVALLRDEGIEVQVLLLQDITKGIVEGKVFETFGET